MTPLPPQPDLNQAFALPDLSLWREAASAALKGADFERSLYRKSIEGIELKALYTAADAAPAADGRRGWRRSGAWEMAQELPGGRPERFAAALSEDLGQGLSGLALDLDALAPESAQALQTALAPLSPGQIPVHVYASEPRAALIALEHWLQAQGQDWSALRGSLCSDGLASLVHRGHGDPQAHFDALAETIKYLQAQGSPLTAIGIDALPWHEAGADAAQELAGGAAALVETVQALAARGITPATSFANTSLRLGTGVHFFMELAKFRAARVLLARIAAAYGCAPAGMRVQARSSRLWLTRKDPYSNYLRQTIGALAAVLGGVDVLSTGAYNESADDDFARRLARNLQLLLRDEVKLDRLIDPTGGSYAVESLTTRLAEAAWERFQAIEAQGGLLAALASGSPQQAVAATARQRLERVHTRKQALIGTNQYADPQEQPLAAVAAAAPATELAPVAAHDLASARAAFAAGASWPSLAAALASQTGGQNQVEALAPLRLAAGFEALRAEARARDYRVKLLPLGPAKDHRARVDFSRALFELAGMRVETAEPANPADSAQVTALAEGADAIVLCSADAVYETALAALAPALKAAYPELPLILAGRPKGKDEAYAAAGIDHFIWLGCDAHALLKELLSRKVSR